MSRPATSAAPGPARPGGRGTQAVEPDPLAFTLDALDDAREELGSIVWSPEGPRVVEALDRAERGVREAREGDGRRPPPSLRPPGAREPGKVTAGHRPAGGGGP